MKRIVAILGIGMIGMTALTFADEQETQRLEKDLCVLYSKNCVKQSESIQDKIKRLKTEIDKGTRVYTPEELKKLQQKLKDLEETIDLLLQPGPSR